MKTVNKYERLLSYSVCNNILYKNKLFINDASQTVIATDGHRMLAVRDLYNETKVLSRLIDAKNGFSYDEKEKLLISNIDGIHPEFESLIFSNERLNSPEFKKLRLEIPSWVKGISKREKKPYVSFVLGDDPVLAMNCGFNAGNCTVDAHFLKDFVDKEINVYIKDSRTQIVVIPYGHTIDSAPWFSLIMPVRCSGGIIGYDRC